MLSHPPCEYLCISVRRRQNSKLVENKSLYDVIIDIMLFLLYKATNKITQEMWIMKTKDLIYVLLVMFLLILTGCGGGAVTDPGGTIKLAWDSNTDADVAGYKIHYGTATGTYDHVIDVGNVTAYHLTGLKQGQTYFIVVTAYNTSNQESDYSNEVSGTAK